ncbi:hypothetical protein EJ08DRAFT_316037 [Tothia fuscella]|uniref:Uncharacterized protein n=1 Tax=Tothia fuscella TaxID=1048955 RepID=A0A9P4TWM0_9PEZI|nr:hypothetical protein EJ08DRAFT_316037 [Tothia fuscella]
MCFFADFYHSPISPTPANIPIFFTFSALALVTPFILNALFLHHEFRIGFSTGGNTGDFAFALACFFLALICSALLRSALPPQPFSGSRNVFSMGFLCIILGVTTFRCPLFVMGRGGGGGGIL